MLRNRLVYLAVLLLLCLFRIAYTGYVAGMLLVIALLLPVFSWIISLPGALCTRITLSMPDQVVRGSEATVTLTLRQSRLFATGTVRGKLKTESVVSGETTFTRLKGVYGGFALNTEHCCVYRCSLRHFRVLDLMGLLPMPTRRPADASVTILPFPSEPPEHPDWSGAAQLIARPFSGAANPYDLREYRTGDTLRAIHWKKSASLDKTVVRDTLEPADRVASVWIDWPQDAHSRDLVLDQLAWCLIYLKQNSAGILLKWLDRQSQMQYLYAAPGEVDKLLPRILAQRAGLPASAALLRPGEILLSGGARGGGKA